MRKIIKRIFASLLMVVMLLTAAPLTGFAFQAEAAETTYKTGDIIEFGSYPQSKVTDSATISQLDNISKNWISYNYYSGTGDMYDGQMKPSDYMKYDDIDVNNDGTYDYRAVLFSKYRPNLSCDTASTDNSFSMQFYNGYSINKIYYFKYETLKWIVIDLENNILVSKNIIDSQPFNNTVYYDNQTDNYYNNQSKEYFAADYSNSSLKSWLNNDFFYTSFNINEQSKIVNESEKVSIISWELYNKIDNGEFHFYDTEYAGAQGLDRRLLNASQTKYLGYPAWYTQINNNGGTKLKENGAFIYAVNQDNQLFNCFVGRTSIGVVPVLKVKNISDLTEQDTQDTFVYEHILFYDRLHSLWEKNSFSAIADYDKINQNNTLSRIYDSIKDAGEVASLQFDDLQITADYYDVYLGNMVLAFAEKSSINDIKFRVGDAYSKSIDAIESFLDSNKEADKLSDYFVIETAFSENYDLSDEAKEVFSQVFKKAYINHPDLFKDIFQGLDCADEVCDYISTGLDAYNNFKDCYQAYCVAQATKNMCTDFFDVCYNTADELEKTNPKFAGWFRENIDKYKTNSIDDAVYFDVAKLALSKAGYIAYDTFLRESIKGVACNQFAKVLGVAPGKILSIIAAYNAGVALGELIAPVDTESAYYLFYIAPVENAMQNVLKQYANSMKSLETYSLARKYEIAFLTLQYTNISLYKRTYDFASAKKILWIRSRTSKNCMEDATFYKGLWQNYKCHSTDYSDINNYKTVGVKCPVDIYLYNSANQLVLAIENEKITTYTDDRIAVDVFEGKKSINYPSTENYSIKIVARENGTMEYTVMSTQDISVRNVEFYDISLSQGQRFDATIPLDHYAKSNIFDLKTNGKNISANYDSWLKVNSVSIGDITLNYKKSATITPIIDADEGAEYTVTYTSSNPSVARVDENGKVYGAKRGSADITVTVTDSYGNSVSDTCKVNVKYSFGQWLIVIVLFGWIWY